MLRVSFCGERGITFSDPVMGELQIKIPIRLWLIDGLFCFQSLTKVRAFDSLKIKNPICTMCSGILLCGERGIRTPGPRERSTVFKTAAFNHSAISPIGAAKIIYFLNEIQIIFNLVIIKILLIYMHSFL